MSKAFTRESDDSGPEEVSSTRPRLPPGAKNLITREGADGLKQRLNALLEKKQALTADRGGSAPDAEQRKIEAAIRNLRQLLDSVVVAEAPVDREKVAFGATVKVRHGSGEEADYRIVGVEEADPERGLISWISPLARALVSRKAGERVRFRFPAGEEELTIVRVWY